MSASIRDWTKPLNFPRGTRLASLVREIILPEIDVVKIRAQTGLSQTDFVRSIGVAKGTFLNWEQRRCTSQGSAQVLLALIARKPSVVRDLLGNT